MQDLLESARVLRSNGSEVRVWFVLVYGDDVLYSSHSMMLTEEDTPEGSGQ